MKKYFNIIICTLLATSYIFAQNADPAVTGANFVPNFIEVDESSQLTFSFSNAGFSMIPVGSIELVVSTADIYYQTDGITVPSGGGAALFDWTYIGTDQWRGVNNVAIIPAMGGDVVFDVIGLVSFNFPQTTNINVGILSDEALFNNNPANDNLQPQLLVTPPEGCTDPEPVITGDFFVCAGSTSTFSIADYNVDNEVVFTAPDGVVLVSTTDDSATYEFPDTPGSYQLVVTESTPDGCEGTAFANIVVEGDIVLICNDNLNISLANSCTLELTYDIILEAPQYDENSYTITIKDENGNVIANPIDNQYINQTLEVSVEHNCSGNICWGDVTIEDKLAPVIACMNDTLTCDEYQNFTPTASIATDNCDDAVLSFTSTEEVLSCDPEFSRIITVIFTAVDGSGNEAEPCTSMYYVEKEFISDIDLPLSYDGLPGNNQPLSCSGNYPLNNLGNPDPSFTGTPGGLNNCSSIEWTYTDVDLPLCDADCETTSPSYKVIRKWVIVDWCTGEIEDYQQIIKVEDMTAPTFANIPDITASVNPFDCSAQVTLPVASATDNCSEDISYTYETEVGTIIDGVLYVDAPAKTMDEGIEVIVYATDCCGNVGETSFEVIIEDNTPPVVVADSHETISLLPSGQATMYATSLDDGSYDNCGPIVLRVKRMDNGGGNPSIDLFPPSGNDNGQFNEVVHFFCSDVGDDPIMVQFQVCDDANMDGIMGGSGDNCNLAMIEVTVQDKYLPVIQCPDPMIISCIDFQGIDLDDEDQLNALFGTPNAAGTCNVSVDQNVTGTTELDCGSGFISRNFTATNGAGTVTCTQQISVVAFDENKLTCDRITFEGLNNNIYNWCDVNDNINNNNDDLPAIDINGCEGINIAEVDVNTAGLCTTAAIQVEIDTFSYPGSSACKKYFVHYEVIDQCEFDENYVDPNTGQIDPFNSDNGYFEFYLEYNVVDNEAPELTCEIVSEEADICEGFTGTVSIVATDACTPDDQLFYEWKIDIGGDGFVDFPTGGAWFSGNAASASAYGGMAIPAGNHVILWKVNDGCGNIQTCSQDVSISPETKKPTPYCFADLSTAVMPINGTINIWANDFDAGSFDACGDLSFTMLPVVDADGLTTAQAYNQSFTHPNVTINADGDYGFQFDCSYIPNGISAVVELRIYVTDVNGNYDFCTSALRIDDNEDVCPNSSMGTVTISGKLNTKEGDPIELVDVELFTNLPEFPINVMTIEDGEFAFNDLLEGLSYDVMPTRNDDHLNGITTLDIVLIQKHILGLATIENPYTLIAADVNSDCVVNGLDIVQLRKLLLGKYVDDILPNSQSWRFVDEDFDFINLQPCNYTEDKSFQSLTINGNADFVGVKIGDVNETAEANIDDVNTDTRSGEQAVFYTNLVPREQNGLVLIDFYAENLTDLNGFQFTMDLQNIQLLNVIPGVLNLTNNNVNQVSNYGNVLNVIYYEANGLNIDADKVLFTLEVEKSEWSKKTTNLRMVTDYLAPEAYLGNNLEIVETTLEIRDKNVSVEDGFILYQNEPNPFRYETNINFYIPQASIATLTINDITGKVVFKKKAEYPSGLNILTINELEGYSAGVLYYTLQIGTEHVTKKMVLIK